MVSLPLMLQWIGRDKQSIATLIDSWKT